jgi:hypothetical protein
MRKGNRSRKDNQEERGAALITVMMITVLLGLACISLLYAVAANSKNTTDTLSETKAFYAAESGMQATLNVLRGHVPPSPLLDAAKPVSDPANEISYIRASSALSSNYSGDPNPPRLSRWLDYNYTPAGGNYADRIVIGEPANTYVPNQGTAYSVTVTDPDDARHATVFETQGKFLSSQSAYLPDFVTDNSNWTRVYYVGAGQTNLTHADDNPTVTNVSLGGFRVEVHGTGGTLSGQYRFQVDYHLISPRASNRLIFGTLDLSAKTVTFDSASYELMGSKIVITSIDASRVQNLNPLISGIDKIVRASIDPAEPYRLLLKSTGYGPNGSRKQIEAIIERNLFNDVSSAAAVSMIGPNPGFTWDAGNSANVSYSGVDPYNSGVSVPSIGVTNQASLDYINANQPQTPLNPPAAVISDELPDWQRSPAALDTVIQSYKTAARDTCCYYANGNSVSSVGSVSGSPPIGSGLTFVDGDFTYTGDGGGVLIVTGKLTLSGNFSFTGLIIVTGSAGVERNGGGNGTITGNMVIAPYNPNNLSAFLPPKYSITGGGISHIVYSGTTTTSFEGTSAVSDFIQGVAEK